MAQQGIRDLVGRVMLDPDFLAELVRSPDAVLTRYELSAEERAAILEAVAKLGGTPAPQRGLVLKTALVKRWAT